MSLAVQGSRRINTRRKLANLAYNGATEMELGSFDGGGNGEHNSVGLVEISETFVTQNQYLNGAALFVEVYCRRQESGKLSLLYRVKLVHHTPHQHEHSHVHLISYTY